MGILGKNKPKKRDLLEMSDVQKYKLIKEVKESLRLKVAEAKLWQSLLESENLTINGEKVHCEDAQLMGLSLKTELFRST
jgi:hypothetical protein